MLRWLWWESLLPFPHPRALFVPSTGANIWLAKQSNLYHCPTVLALFYVCFCPTEERPGVRLRFWPEWPKIRVSKTENQLNLQSYFPLSDASKSSLLKYGIGFHRSLQFKTAFPAPHKGCPFPFLCSSFMALAGAQAHVFISHSAWHSFALQSCSPTAPQYPGAHKTNQVLKGLHCG